MDEKEKLGKAVEKYSDTYKSVNQVRLYGAILMIIFGILHISIVIVLKRYYIFAFFGSVFAAYGVFMLYNIHKTRKTLDNFVRIIDELKARVDEPSSKNSDS